MTKTIQIEKIREVADFVAAASKVTGDVHARKGESKVVVDGKSLMGMFSIDPSSPVIIEYPAGEMDFEEFLVQFEV